MILQGISKVVYYITPCKRVSAGTGCWGPCWFRGAGDSTASLKKQFYCSGNLAETLSDPCFVVYTALWHREPVIHCLLSEHASMVTCRNALRALCKHQESMAISAVQTSTALSQTGLGSLSYTKSSICLCRHSCSAYPGHRQASFLTQRKFLHRQDCSMSRKRQEHFCCWHSFHENPFLMMPWVTVSRTVWLMATLQTALWPKPSLLCHTLVQSTSHKYGLAKLFWLLLSRQWPTKAGQRLPRLLGDCEI